MLCSGSGISSWTLGTLSSASRSCFSHVSLGICLPCGRTPPVSYVVIIVREEFHGIIMHCRVMKEKAPKLCQNLLVQAIKSVAVAVAVAVTTTATALRSEAMKRAYILLRLDEAGPHSQHHETSECDPLELVGDGDSPNSNTSKAHREGEKVLFHRRRLWDSSRLVHLFLVPSRAVALPRRD